MEILCDTKVSELFFLKICYLVISPDLAMTGI